MLTVKEINEVSFGKAGFSGYKPEDVDRFIDTVAASFQQLEAERDDALKRAQELSAKNSEMQEKLSILAQRVESYRKDEENIKDVLLDAQKMAKGSVSEAKDKAEIILQDAQDSARQILDNAKIEASQAAKEYMARAEEKKAELEEIKRQVSAFRASLLEMYKKHLECINHIPNFRQKEETAEPAEEAPAPEEPAPVTVPAPAPAPVPAAKPEPAAVEKQKPAEERPKPPKQPDPVPAVVHTEPEQKAPVSQPTLHDRVNFSQEQAEPVDSDEEEYLDDDLTGVGIDLKAYNNIPESLRKEKSSHYSHLEFGDDVDLGNKKRKK